MPTEDNTMSVEIVIEDKYREWVADVFYEQVSRGLMKNIPGTKSFSQRNHQQQYRRNSMFSIFRGGILKQSWENV